MQDTEQKVSNCFSGIQIPLEFQYQIETSRCREEMCIKCSDSRISREDLDGFMPAIKENKCHPEFGTTVNEVE